MMSTTSYGLPEQYATRPHQNKLSAVSSILFAPPLDNTTYANHSNITHAEELIWVPFVGTLLLEILFSFVLLKRSDISDMPFYELLSSSIFAIHHLSLLDITASF